jgi:hypothetical protein
MRSANGNIRAAPVPSTVLRFGRDGRFGGGAKGDASASERISALAGIIGVASFL